ncbi:MAG: hypothetical protein AAF633_15335, partial [Chloroflexota bacterium]
MHYFFHSNRLATFRLCLTIIIFSILFWLSGSSTLTAQTHDPDAQSLIELAWEKVEEAEEYGFRTRIDQQVYPAPSIANAGRPPEEATLGISGTFEKESHRMETTVWSDGTFDPNSGADMLIENGRSYVRQPGQTEWEEVNDFSGSFAPGGDPISFLSGMSNVQETGNDERTVGEISISFTTYSFDLNGPEMAVYVNRISTEMLQRQGELPQGMTSAAGETFRDATGLGRVWIGEDGYLARIELNLSLPTDEDGERVEAQLISDFYDYVLPEPNLAPSLVERPSAWVEATLIAAAQPEARANLIWLILVITLSALLAFFVWQTVHTKAFYNTIASLVITSMIMTPLIHANEASAFNDTQAQRSEEHSEREEMVDQYEAVRAEALSNDWNPLTAPSLSSPYLLDKAASPEAAPMLSLANSSGDSSLDSDNDGVNDADEALWDSCPYANPSTAYDNEEDCNNVSDPADSDGDTLSDYAEIYELGTLPDAADSDGDSIDDQLEVQGFSYNGTQWYLDPLEI